MKIATQIVLWAIIAFLGFKLVKSINGPVEFNKIKEERYAQVIQKLKDIQSAQLAYQNLYGKFTGSYDSLIQFIDTAQYAITTRRDTSYADRERNRAFGLNAEDGGYYLEKIIIDTIGFKTVKDSLFKGSDRYKQMNTFNASWLKTPIEIELNAGKIDRKNSIYAVFEARIPKDKLLADQDANLLAQEKQTVSVEGVNGAFIKVGDMEDINTSGNWPKFYESKNN